MDAEYIIFQKQNKNILKKKNMPKIGNAYLIRWMKSPKKRRVT